MFTLSHSSKVKKEASFTLRLSAFKLVPRWLIFLIDVAVCAGSFLLAFILFYNFNLSELYAHTGLNRLALINIFVCSGVFLYKKSYAGIIRLSSLQDMMRVFSAICSISVILLGIKVIFDMNNFVSLPLNVILKHFLIMFFMLTSYRSLVKWTFEAVEGKSDEQINVVIFGAGDSGQITKQVIDHSRHSGLHIHAFVDDSPNKIGKYIGGVRIYNAKNDLIELKRKYNIQQVIFSIQNLDTKRKSEMVDLCLNLGIKVVNVPPVKNWINGEFTLNQLRNIKIEELLERDVIKIDNKHICSQLRNKNILITGAAGSIGSEIVRQIAFFEPSRIILCDQAETALYSIELEVNESFPKINFSPVIIDIKNKERMELLFKLYKPEYVFHAAAYKHVPMMECHPSEAVLNNIGGTKVVADLAVKYNAEKFVMVSTDKAVNPTNVMGASKRIAEIYAQSLNDYLKQADSSTQTKFITTRFGNVLGSNGSVIPRFREQISKGGPVTVTHPEINRYFMTIPEACQLVLEAATMGDGGEIFVFDMGKSVKIVDLAKKMIQLSGLTIDKDIKIVYSGLRPGEKLYEELLNDSEYVKPTHHEKIMIAKVRKYSFETTRQEINELLDAASKMHDNKIVQKMKHIVPEFKSKHSVFEVLDTIDEISTVN
ncbi:polysaccharide biosynthesis protein [Solitalea longa]|uniref:Polysaccharide biosynthesis protein n=1 Tax=Solitalea longa TaxID=2079460 RepID=A0A2S5A0X9_9SPHI|nr:nucleoside-diphosphate sugar epimerase/dehydratase [Solitalea longa]POY35783.1 polysaccharide biosynthesis protein [Solitalea longa]